MQTTTEKFKILNQNSVSEWNEILNKISIFSGQQIYKNINYLISNIKDHNTTPEAFFYEKNNKYFFLSYLKSQINSLNEKYYDFETAYGYSGPITNSNENNFLEEAWLSFEKHCEENKIICGIIRFDPYINNNFEFYKNKMNLSFEGPVAIRNYQTLKNHKIKNYSNSINEKVKKSIKLNIKFYCSNNHIEFEKFKEIYLELMKSKNAKKNYLFDDDYFKKIRKLDDNLKLFLITLNKEVIGGAITLESNNISSIHLSAVKRKYLSTGASVFLRFNIIDFYKKKDFYSINLGGGISDSKNDSLFKFKEKFSNEIKNYFIGKCLFNKNIYYELCNNFERNLNNENKAYQNYFLKYRYK